MRIWRVGIEWDFIDIIAKGLFYLFWVNEFCPFGCIKDLSEPICQHPSLHSEQSLCRLLHPQPAEYCVLAGALSSTCLHWKSDCREELVLEASCFLCCFVSWGFFVLFFFILFKPELNCSFAVLVGQHLKSNKKLCVKQFSLSFIAGAVARPLSKS